MPIKRLYGSQRPYRSQALMQAIGRAHGALEKDAEYRPTRSTATGFRLYCMFPLQPLSGKLKVLLQRFLGQGHPIAAIDGHRVRQTHQDLVRTPTIRFRPGKGATSFRIDVDRRISWFRRFLAIANQVIPIPSYVFMTVSVKQAQLHEHSERMTPGIFMKK